MIASGEQSGELESMLTRAADNQDQNFESTVNIALGVFTPALIALMAGLVLFIVMATLMPMLEMTPECPLTTISRMMSVLLIGES